jgi:hypothetical protein
MRLFAILMGLCGALWWVDSHFFRGEYLQALQREAVQLNSVFHREIDKIVRSVS